MRLYLDAGAIIYLIEAQGPARSQVQRWQEQVRTSDHRALVTSRLSRVECRTKPLRERNRQLLWVYETFFSHRLVEIAEIGGAVLERATQLRAEFGFKTPDAIHLATALQAETDRVLTGDRQLAKYTTIPIELLG